MLFFFAEEEINATAVRYCRSSPGSESYFRCFSNALGTCVCNLKVLAIK